MNIFKIFRPRKKVGASPEEMMRTFEEVAKKTDKKSFFRGDTGKKK